MIQESVILLKQCRTMIDKNEERLEKSYQVHKMIAGSATRNV